MRRRHAHSGDSERNGGDTALANVSPAHGAATPNAALAAAAAGVPTTGTFSGGLIRYPVPVTRQAPPPPAASPLYALLGLHQLQSAEAWRAASIEFVATTLMTFMSIGIIASAGAQGNPPLYIGLAHAILLTLLIFCAAAPSGGHMNPSITLATILTGHTPAARGLLYVIAQTVGAILGSAFMFAVLPDATIDATHLGGCRIGPNIDQGGAFVAEFMFTFVLLFIAYGCALDARQGAVFGPVLAPPLIGITMGGIIYVSGAIIPGFTGAGMNAARCFGPDVVMGSVSSEQWVFWLAPALACVVHALLYASVPPHHKDVFAARGTQRTASQASGKAASDGVDAGATISMHLDPGSTAAATVSTLGGDAAHPTATTAQVFVSADGVASATQARPANSGAHTTPAPAPAPRATVVELPATNRDAAPASGSRV